VYTLPAQIADIAYQNKAVISDLLFRASAETTLTIAADPTHLGVGIGVMWVLRTWSSALTHHPHVHMVEVRAPPSTPWLPRPWSRRRDATFFSESWPAVAATAVPMSDEPGRAGPRLRR
jgi:hypothetical protein